jgi:hypothetical protein
MFNESLPPTKEFCDAAFEVMNENKRRFEILPTMKVAI